MEGDGLGDKLGDGLGEGDGLALADIGKTDKSITDMSETAKAFFTFTPVNSARWLFRMLISIFNSPILFLHTDTIFQLNADFYIYIKINSYAHSYKDYPHGMRIVYTWKALCF